MRTLFSVTYEIVTPESAEQGDADDLGWIVQGVSLRDAVDAVHATRTNRVDGVTSIECDSYPATWPRWITVTNGMEFETGANESRSLHLPQHLTGATRRRIARLIGARV